MLQKLFVLHNYPVLVDGLCTLHHLSAVGISAPFQRQTHRVLSLPAEPLGQLSILTLTNFDLFHLVQNIHTINDHANNGVFACSQNASVKLCIWMK